MTYSEKIKGNPGNYDWQVRFDLTDGYLGITQFEGEQGIDKTFFTWFDTNIVSFDEI